jgi:hypothetical protein
MEGQMKLGLPLLGWAGVIAGAGLIFYLQQRNHVAEDIAKLHDITSHRNDIVFPKKVYSDSPGGRGVVSISGTLTGPGVRYANNYYSVNCFQQENLCMVSSVDQIASRMISQMDGPWPYSILTWDADEIVATEERSEAFCIKNTITIDRRRGSLLWLTEPARLNKPACKDYDEPIRNLTIEDSPFWKRKSPSDENK